MDEGAEVPACAETEGVTIFCCLYTGSPDCFRVLPVQEGAAGPRFAFPCVSDSNEARSGSLPR